MGSDAQGPPAPTHPSQAHRIPRPPLTPCPAHPLLLDPVFPGSEQSATGGVNSQEAGNLPRVRRGQQETRVQRPPPHSEGRVQKTRLLTANPLDLPPGAGRRARRLASCLRYFKSLVMNISTVVLVKGQDGRIRNQHLPVNTGPGEARTERMPEFSPTPIQWVLPTVLLGQKEHRAVGAPALLSERAFRAGGSW